MAKQMGIYHPRSPQNVPFYQCIADHFKEFIDVEHVSGLCRKAGIKLAYYHIFGGPGEDTNTIEKTFTLCRRLNPTAVIALIGIRIYLSTLLASIAYEEAVISKDGPLLDPKFYFSPYFRERKDTLCDDVAKYARTERN